jgi:hypothetical protein
MKVKNCWQIRFVAKNLIGCNYATIRSTPDTTIEIKKKKYILFIKMQ